MSLTFAERLTRAQQASGSLLCVGLDPDPAKLPQDLAGAPELRAAQNPFGGASAYMPIIRSTLSMSLP